VKKFVLLFNCRLLLLDQYSTFNPTITHLITDEIGSSDSLVCTLTKTVVFAIAQHCFILSYRWICQCLQENLLVNEEQYEIEGDHMISLKHNGPRRSRLSKQPLLPMNHFSMGFTCVVFRFIFMLSSKLSSMRFYSSDDQRFKRTFS
jgi:hypothetical protein